MTEAQILQHPPSSFLDKTLMVSFCTEMIALIPDSLATVAADSVRAEVARLAAQGTHLSPQAQEILDSQTFLFPDAD